MRVGSIGNRCAWRPARALAAAVALVALFAGAAPAHAKKPSERLVTVEGVEAPGPADFDHVNVLEVGPRKADNVLVLVPGTAAGAGDFTLIARDLVRRIDDLQVWATERRSQALEDTSMFERALKGRASAEEAFDYYLGWILDPSVEKHFDFLDAGTVPFAREWGLDVALGDLRNVVRKAGRGGRDVILGGHSLGASMTAAYASWDFDGRPGYRDIEGMVLIDGGLLGSFDGFDLAQAQAALAELESSSPFLDLIGAGLPEATGLFAEGGALFARQDPRGRSPVQDFPFLPPAFRPPVSVTNRALFAHAFDADTSPEELALIHVRAGRLAASGDPRDWRPGEVTPVRRLVDTFAQEPANGVEWYFPARLTIDTNGADELERNEVADFLGLRPWHAEEVDVPLYAFQTELTDGGVLRGARNFIERARTTRRESKLVDGSDETSHLDPLTGRPAKNPFLKSVVPFLEDLTR